MKIKTLFFGISSDLVKNTQLELSVKKDSSIKEFKDLLMKKYPQLKNINSYAIAVNEEYANDNFILNESDVVAIIPPVSGG